MRVWQVAGEGRGMTTRLAAVPGKGNEAREVGVGLYGLTSMNWLKKQDAPRKQPRGCIAADGC